MLKQNIKINPNMKKYLLILLVLIYSTGLFGQGLYNNGGKIVIGSAATIYISGVEGNYRNESNITDASINLSGTLKIDGNLTNNVSDNDIFEASAVGSEVVLSGSTTQTIGGSTQSTFTFVNLTLNNTNGIILQQDCQVNGNFTITTGLVSIGNNNFIFGPSSAIIGSPSVSGMIIATGTGQVQKIFSAIGTFTFPVGDTTDLADYSPVTLDLTSGTLAPGAFIGLNLDNTKYDSPLITDSYLNRYWEIVQSGITDFTCDAVFQYHTDDVVGVESDINFLKVFPELTILSEANTELNLLTASGLTSLGVFTGGIGTKTINLTLFLEGLYLGGNEMRQAQGDFGNQYPGNTADIISVELHDAVNYSVITHTASNINLSSTGQSTFTVPGTYSGSYYMTIRHRNSIETTSSAPVSLALGTINYDFTTSATQAYANNMKNVGGVYLIYSGDVDQDGFVGVSDMSGVDNQSALFGSGYLTEDLNGDGFVGVPDMAIIDNNSANFVSTITP